MPPTAHTTGAAQADAGQVMGGNEPGNSGAFRVACRVVFGDAGETKAKGGKPKPAEGKPGSGKPSRLHGAGNCGTGHGGFKPGNTCGKTGRAKLAEHLRNARKRTADSPEDAHKVRLAARELRHHRRGKDGAIDRETAMEHAGAIRGGKTPEPSKVPEKKPKVASKPEAKPESKPQSKPADKPMDKPTPKPVATPAAESPSSTHQSRPQWSQKPDKAFSSPSDHEMRYLQDDWAGGLSNAHRNAIAEYTHGDYMEINATARHPGFANKYPSYLRDNADSVAKVHALESALSGATAPVDMVVYRGMEHSGLKAAGIDHRSLREGAVIDLHGFNSTSLSRKTANDFGREEGLLTIRVPAGTPGGYVNAVKGGSRNAHENEFLMPPSASRFRFIKSIDHGNGNVELVVEASPY